MDNSRNISNPIPSGISDYINKRFDGAFLSEIIEGRDREGQRFFTVNVSYDNLLYHLKFNSSGAIVEESNEPIWELYDTDEFDMED